ncbi:trimethylamine methyltransferase [Chromatiales bacterium (ex Bugula neritina AB1)]|nr:trimethylamine methyltransferase [Chromatiales bacterium (ex Bugula neritina AB1)]
MQPRTSRTARRGRKKRSARRDPATAATPTKRLIPAYELLNEADLRRLEQQADWLLDTIGVEFRGDSTAIELFREAGARIDGERLRFEHGLVRSLCSTAPAEFKLHSRNPNHSLTLGGQHIVLMPGYGSPFVTDTAHGRRYATLQDFHNFVKLTYITPNLHHSGGTVCEPTDVPVNKRHLDMVYAHLRLSTKPFMGSVTSPSRAQDSIDMARIVYGSHYLENHAVMQGNINVNSPFIYDKDMSGALRVYAQANQCVCVSPAIFAGAMGPVSMAAVCAQTLAEGMVGIALSQLVRPGCPAVLGSFHSTMNLRNGSLTFGTPEANLASMALSQLGRRLGVPVRSGGGQITASNTTDGQAMTDSANAMWATMLSGSHQVWHAAGWLEGGLTMSYEKFVLDLDNCGAMMKLMHGLCVDDESLSPESYFEAGPGDNFLSTSHTMNHFSTANYESLLPDASAYETWVENGSLRSEQRAASVYKTMLSHYIEPDMDENINQNLIDFIEEKKASMPDKWH